jgi:HEAT repeat protein
MLKHDTPAKFQRTLTLLRNPEASFTAEAIYSLSDLDGERLQAFQTVWSELPAERRRSLVLRLVETAETNFELDFSAIIIPALHDSDPEVRLAAVEGILEESPRSVIERLMHIAQEDPYSEVRAGAIKALGQFVLLGELGKLPGPLNLRLQDMLLALHRNLNEDLDVRRRALEAIGNCGREGVNDMIREAYYADELPMRASAVFAMGRTCDDVWLPQIREELSSDYPEMRYEAARAAGELELRQVLPRLAELAYEDDREIQEMAIWALGEIGGKTARKVLKELALLADSGDDEELADAIAEAQAVAALSGTDALPLFDFSEYESDLDEDGADDLESLYISRHEDGAEDEDEEEESDDLDDLKGLLRLRDDELLDDR